MDNNICNSTQEPPVKKQKTLEGTGNATAVGEESDPTLKRKNLIESSHQYQSNNYRGALQEYFQKKKGGIMPVFSAIEKSEPRALKKIFEATCKAGDETGTGEAGTKKHAYQLAALDVIQKLMLIPVEHHGPTTLDPYKKLTVKPPQQIKKKDIPMVENKQYVMGNYRGALQEYFVKNHPGVKLGFEMGSSLQEGSLTSRFIATCKVNGSTDEKFTKIEAIGSAISKKSAIQQSALQFLLKLELISADNHPDAQ